MSIISDAMRGKTTWGTAASRIEGWIAGKVSDSPALLALKTAAMTSVKQGVSNALALADTELGLHFAAMVDGVETAADAALLKATGGLAIPAIPLMNSTIKQLADAGRAAFDAWELEQQAKLAPATGPNALPPLSPQAQNAHLSGGSGG